MLSQETATSLLAAHGQEHVLRFFATLSQTEKKQLLQQIEQLDLSWLEWVLRSDIEPVHADDIAPCRQVIRLGDAAEKQALACGEEALRVGRVGCLLVAGGQGTRLGFDGPKGALPLGAVSGRTLYQIHAERLFALGQRYKAIPPLYLMTSEANHQATIDLFARHDYFGLPQENVFIFQQGLAPAVNEQGKLLMDAPHHIVMTPNGNGGLFASLKRSDALAHMKERAIDTISYIQVDNPLALSCDPRFVGYHLLRESQYSCKAIRKTGPEEKVGSYALVKGKLRVVEYTELPAALAGQTDAQGDLLYSFSNPGLFVWSYAFIAAQAERKDLPFHQAHKKIPCLDETQSLVQPVSPNGYKFEAFAMDTLPDAERSIVLECIREAEFAPVKNATGVDSPASARVLMTQLYASWIDAAGGQVIDQTAAIEINPLYALDQEELAHKLPAGFRVTRDVCLANPAPGGDKTTSIEP